MFYSELICTTNKKKQTKTLKKKAPKKQNVAVWTCRRVGVWECVGVGFLFVLFVFDYCMSLSFFLAT